MDDRTIEIPKKMVEALKRLDYHSLFHNRRTIQTLNPITLEMEDEEVPSLSYFGAEGNADDLSLFQYLVLMAMHAYDDDNNERQVIDEHFKEYLY